MDKSQAELLRIYDRRFASATEYRRRIWQVLAEDYFQRLIPPTAAILDLGCGYGEFINAIRAGAKFGMDLNPNSQSHLTPDITLFQQDCSQRWPLDDGNLDVVFTSNFFEHLPDKASLGRAIEEAFRCLKAGGQLIAIGPNIRFTGGRYWDFWDHYLPLTESSMCEGLAVRGFKIEECRPRFLPYTMARGPEYPLAVRRVYLRFPLLWRLFGKQFLIVARKPWNSG